MDENVAILSQEVSFRIAIQHVFKFLEFYKTCASYICVCVITTGPDVGKVCSWALRRDVKVQIEILFVWRSKQVLEFQFRPFTVLVLQEPCAPCICVCAITSRPHANKVCSCA